MDYVRQALMDKYTLQLCHYEMALYDGRQTRLHGKMQQYFNSTPVKNAFARLMYIAANVKSLYTKTAISQKLHITRQAAHQMVNECLDGGWIIVDQDGRCPTYKATETLINGVKLYAAFALDSGENIGVVNYRQAISNYDAAERKAGLYCPDNSSVLDFKIPDTGEESDETREKTDSLRNTVERCSFARPHKQTSGRPGRIAAKA
tara:strand:- start:2745 stop:3359 length:615 start_codon:yes stop_codon:yes gene_type:complete